MRKCNRCNNLKAEFLFPINKKCTGGFSHICKKCENTRQQEARDIAKDWKYPYGSINDPNRLNDMHKLFATIAKKKREGMGFRW